MFAVLLHGGWDTLVAAALFWLSPFVVAFLIIKVGHTQAKRRGTHSGL